MNSDHEANASQLGEANSALFSDFACGAALFGKPAKFHRVLRRAGVDPARAIAIGDEVRDIEAARSAGIACAAVTWGLCGDHSAALTRRTSSSSRCTRSRLRSWRGKASLTILLHTDERLLKSGVGCKRVVFPNIHQM